MKRKEDGGDVEKAVNVGIMKESIVRMIVNMGISAYPKLSLQCSKVRSR